MFEKLQIKLPVSIKLTSVNVVLITNSIVWYFFIIHFLESTVAALNIDYVNALIIWILHFGAIAGSAIAGAAYGAKLKGRTRFLSLWLLFGVICSLASVFIDKSFMPNVIVLAVLLGASLGIGMPSCMGYFSENISNENRGRTGGFMILLSGFAMAAIGMINESSIGLQTLLLSGWRIFGLVFFIAFKFSPQIIQASKPLSYHMMFKHRPFILYLLPWFLFSLITYLTIPLQSDIVGKSTVGTLVIVENALTGVFAVAGGFLSDYIGRKRIAIAGFALLGLAYSVLGIFPYSLFSWYFYTIIDGVAWGILYVIFVTTIWGDLGGQASDKYYAIGVLPFFISKFMQLSVGNSISSLIPTEAIFSFTAFFLFLAVLPLAYAPETLPEKTFKDRELKSYLDKANKIKSKYM